MRTVKRNESYTKPGKDAWYFLLSLLSIMLLGLPGAWCFLAGGLAVTFFLLFLHATRGECRTASASRIHPHAVLPDINLPHRDAC
jgi:hypothetical protein